MDNETRSTLFEYAMCNGMTQDPTEGRFIQASSCRQLRIAHLAIDRNLIDKLEARDKL